VQRPDGKRWPANTKELLNLIEKTANEANMSYEFYEDFSPKSIKEQLEIVSRSSIMISHSGGGAYMAIFMPAGSTLILINPTDDNSDLQFWPHFAHMKVIFAKHDGTLKNPWSGTINLSSFYFHLQTGIDNLEDYNHMLD